MNERGDVGDLLVGHRELRHAGAAAAHHRGHQLALVVGEHQRRAQQTRSAIAAAGVRAVTELAIHAVQAFAALDRRRISGRPHRVILTALRRCSPATTTAATAWRGLRVSRGSDQYQQRTARRRSHPSARVARSAFNVGRHT